MVTEPGGGGGARGRRGGKGRARGGGGGGGGGGGVQEVLRVLLPEASSVLKSIKIDLESPFHQLRSN